MDAPLPRGFTHWTIYNIPPQVSAIAEGEGDQYTEGLNSDGSNGYIGPDPPAGHGIHHYYFWLYALDRELNLKAGLTGETGQRRHRRFTGV